MDKLIEYLEAKAAQLKLAAETEIAVDEIRLAAVKDRIEAELEQLISDLHL
jgi:hypothetical protein